MLNRPTPVKEWNGLKIGDICKVKDGVLFEGSIFEVKGLWNDNHVRANVHQSNEVWKGLNMVGERRFFLNSELLKLNVDK